MRPTTVIKALLTFILLLAVISFFATYKAFYYRDKYVNNPLIKVQQHSSIIYGKFDPNRSQAYTCKTQSVDKYGVGMVCNSPDGSTTINCTVGGDVGQYFC